MNKFLFNHKNKSSAKITVGESFFLTNHNLTYFITAEHTILKELTKEKRSEHGEMWLDR